MSKVQDDEVGDGTTSVAVLASELLKVRFVPFSSYSNSVIIGLNRDIPDLNLPVSKHGQMFHSALLQFRLYTLVDV